MAQRTLALRFSAFAVAVSLSLSVLGAEPVFENAEAVDFESVPYTYPLSPFKVKQAKKKGITLKPEVEPSIPLKGFLDKPEGAGPHPAIVLMHGCAGITEQVESWSDRFVDWGYVVLSVDSFTPRGVSHTCGREINTPWLRVLDAFGAKMFLATLSFVDAARIAVMGMSRGANAVLQVIRLSTSTDLAISPFRAAVMLYPFCKNPEPIGTASLILMGSEDTWTPPDRCVQYLEKLPPPHEMTLKVIEGAHHGFDHPGIDIVEVGHIVRSDSRATNQAIQIAREFLNTHM